MPVVLPERLEEMLKELKDPQAVWKYMLAVTQIPRGSNMDGQTHRHKKIQAYLKGLAEELGCEAIVDKGENLIIRKAAYPGLEGKPTVCLQCHMDMVVQKNDDVVIDFENDPIQPRIDGAYLKATGTSLGADNGIGIAACFAVLESKDIKHGPLEILVTRDEETGLYGAAELEPGILKAKYMINVDSEEEKAVCVGCAGGFKVVMKLPTPRQPVEDYVKKTITLNNFLGGHSGVDIGLGRANPLHLVGRLLSVIQCCCQPRLVNVDCGTAHNAIPRKCVCTVAIPAAKVECFQASIKKEFDLFYEEYKTIEKDCTCTITDSQDTMNPVTCEFSCKFVNFLNTFPFAVMRMSPTVAGTVETSCTCAIARMSNEYEVAFTASVRSFSASQMDFMYRKLRSFCCMSGMTITPKEGAYPGWTPNVKSPLTLALIEANEKVFGVPPKVYAIHAGLECGLFMEKYADMDCSSIGPEVNYPHSPDERLLIETVPRFFKIVEIALEKLAA